MSTNMTHKYEATVLYAVALGLLCVLVLFNTNQAARLQRLYDKLRGYRDD